MGLTAFADIEPAPDGQADNQNGGHVAELDFSGGAGISPTSYPARRAQDQVA